MYTCSDSKKDTQESSPGEVHYDEEQVAKITVNTHLLGSTAP